MPFHVEAIDSPKLENKRLILSPAHRAQTKSLLMQALHFAKTQSGFWEISCHFEEGAIRTLVIREIRLIGSECDMRVFLNKDSCGVGAHKVDPEWFRKTELCFSKSV